MLSEKYERHMRDNGTERHVWSVKNERGGLHVWAHQHDDDYRMKWGQRYWGGIEMHSPRPLHEGQEGKPHHDKCWLLGVPCWHDGSSLQFDEQIEPILSDDICGQDHSFVFDLLRRRHAYYFGDPS